MRSSSLTLNVSADTLSRIFAVVAQLVEHVHGKDKVTGSIPVNGSMQTPA